MHMLRQSFQQVVYAFSGSDNSMVIDLTDLEKN